MSLRDKHNAACTSCDCADAGVESIDSTFYRRLGCTDRASSAVVVVLPFVAEAVPSEYRSSELTRQNHHDDGSGDGGDDDDETVDVSDR